MALFREDPIDSLLPNTAVKYYLGKITGAGSIGSRNAGKVIPYFTGQDIGAIQSTSLLQNFNTLEFKDSSFIENTAWTNIITSSNTAGTVSKSYGFMPPITNVSWTSIAPFNDSNNRLTEVNYCNAILEPATQNELIANFGWFSISQDINAGLPGAIAQPNDQNVFEYLSGIRDDPSKSLVTQQEFESTKFPNSDVNKNILSLFNSLYGSNEAEIDSVFDRSISSFYNIDGYVIKSQNQIDDVLGSYPDWVHYTGAMGVNNMNALSGILDNYNYVRTGLSGQIQSQEIDWNVYMNSSDLPDPSIHHGMFAHVHSEDAAYMAHAGQWEKIYPQSFTGLSDTPSSLTADKYLKVNSAGDGFTFADAGGGGGGDSSGCCNTIKIRKSTADVPTSDMAASAINFFRWKYGNAFGNWSSWQNADLSVITDNDSSTHWQPTTSASFTKYSVELDFNDAIYINSIQWSGSPWWGRISHLFSTQATIDANNSQNNAWQLTNNTQFPFLNASSEKLGAVTDNAISGAGVPGTQLSWANLPGSGTIKRIKWYGDNLTGPVPAGTITPAIQDIKLAYSLTDPSTPTYIVDRPFANGISASTNPTIYLQRGQSYTFEIDSNGNPFYIKTANSAGTSDLFSAGVTNNGVTEGNLTFQVPYDAPETLYYVSSNVSTLSGMIKILAADGGSHGGGSNSGFAQYSGINKGSFAHKLPEYIYLIDSNGDANTIGMLYAPYNSVDGDRFCYQTNAGASKFICFNKDADGTLQANSLQAGSNIAANKVSLKTYIDQGRVHYAGGGSSSSISTTGITGATNLGAGSGLISGITDNNLQVKSLVGGTNVTLSSDDNTITINASAGGGGGSCSGILNYRGTFVEGTDYEANDFVTYNGKSYVATSATNGFDPSGYKNVIYFDDGDSTDGWLARSPATVSVQTLNGNDTLKAAGTAATTIYVGRNLDLSAYTGSWVNNTGDYVVNADVLASTATPHLLFTYHPDSNDVNGFWSTNGGADNPPSGIVLGDDYSGSGPAAGVVGKITGRIAPTGTGLYIGLRTRDDAPNTYANYDNIVIAEDIASTNPWSLLAGEIAVNNCNAGGGGDSASVNNDNFKDVWQSSTANPSAAEFYSILPDFIVIGEDDETETLYLNTISGPLANYFTYQYQSISPDVTNSNRKNVRFNTDLNGTLWNATAGHANPQSFNVSLLLGYTSLKDFIDNDRAGYFGGSSSAGSSMGGNQYIKNESSFSQVLPDAIISPNDDGAEHTFVLSSVTSGSSSAFIDGDLSQGLTHWTGGAQYDRSDHAIPTINQGGLYGGSTTDKTAWGQTIDTTPGITYTVGWNVTFLSNAAGWYRVYAGNSADFENDTIIYNSAGATGPLTATFTAAQTQTNISWYAAGPNINVAASGMYIEGAQTPKIIYLNPDHGSLEFTNDSSGAADSIPSDYPELSLSGYIASGRAAYFGGGGSSSSSSTTGITGATNLGAGSGLISGITDNDLQVKSLVGGTNVTLSSDDNTITINAAGGGGGGGGGGGSSSNGALGSNSLYSGISNFSGVLPDALIMDYANGPSAGGSYYRYELNWINDDYIYYYDTYSFSSQPPSYLKFNNDVSGTYDEARINGNKPPTASNKPLNISISGFIDSGRAVYYGGGSSSSGGGSSTASGTGIGNSLFFEDRSNYYSRIPDEIIFNGATTVSDFSFSARLASVRDGATNPEIRYDFLTTNGDNDYIRFTNNAQGTYNSALSAGGFSVSQISGMSATDSLSGLIESGIFEPVYYNLGGSSTGGGSASSVSGGVNSNPAISALSNFTGIIPDSLLLQNTSNPVWYITFDFYGIETGPSATSQIQYRATYDDINQHIMFDNDSSGKFATKGTTFNWISGQPNCLQDMIDDGLAIFAGGGGSSSSSSSAGGGGAGSSNVQSVYTGDATSLQFINLGFTPEMVQIQGPDNTAAGFKNPNAIMYKSMSGVSWAYTYNTTDVNHTALQNVSTEGGITGNGFVVPSTHGFNNNGIVYNYMAFGSAGGGSSSSGGIGSNATIQSGSNFSGIIPDEILVNQASYGTTKFQFRQVTSGYIQYMDVYESNYVQFDNDSNGTNPSINNGVGTYTLLHGATTLQDIIDNDDAIYFGGAGASSNSGITNSVITSQSSFSGTLPNAVLVSGVGASSSSFYMASYVGTAAGYLMYAAGVNNSLTARIDFNHDASGTLNNDTNCTTPYSSLQEMIDSGVAIYY